METMLNSGRISVSQPKEYWVQWGKMRQVRYSLRRSLVVFLAVQVFLCKVVQGVPVPVEVEGELSELVSPGDVAVAEEARNVDESDRMAIRLIQEAAEEEDDDETMEMEGLREAKELAMPKVEAVKVLLHKLKQIEETAAEKEEMEEELERSASEARTENARAIWSEEDFDRRAAELCGTKASLDCGKKILSLIDGQESDLNIHMKCDLRDDFLKCIDSEKKSCLDMAKVSMLPDLPPKDVIKVEQSKLWKVLWTAGGCVLAN